MERHDRPGYGYVDVIALAADMLDAQGWCANSLVDDAGHLCLVGAVARAAAELGVACASDPYVTAQRILWPDFQVPAQWNDRTGRSRDEVIARLRRVAEIRAGLDSAPSASLKPSEIIVQ